MLKRRKRANASRLRFEALEGRLMLSATDFVTVKVDHGSLIITGNNADNAIQLTHLGGGTYQVDGLPGLDPTTSTTINGPTLLTKTVSGVTKDIKVDMKGGSDVFFFGELPFDLLPTVPPPPPVLPAPTNRVPRDLIINMGAGDDSCGIGQVAVNRNLEINMGSGVDDIGLAFSTVGKNLKMTGGAQGSTFGLAVVSVFGEAEIKTGRGSDTIGLDAVSVAKEIEVKTGGGSDTILATLDATTLETADVFTTFTLLEALTPAELDNILLAIAQARTTSLYAKEAEFKTGDGNLKTVDLEDMYITKEVEVELGKGTGSLTFINNVFRKAELEGPRRGGANTLTLFGNTGKLKVEHL